MTRTEWIKDLARRARINEINSYNKANAYAVMARQNLVPSLNAIHKERARVQLNTAAYWRAKRAEILRAA